MLKRITTYTLWVIFCSIFGSQAALGAQGDILSSFTINNEAGDGRVPTSIQGIAYYNGYLWVADFGSDRIYRVYPDTVYDTDGTTVLFDAGDSDFNIPLTDNPATTSPQCNVEFVGQVCGGGGLTFAQNFFWNASPVTDEIIKIDPVDGDNLESENTLASAAFPAPADITYDGTYFWVSDIDSDTINQVLPEDGSVLSSIPGPSALPSKVDDPAADPQANIFGITWDGQALWATDTEEDKIYRVSAADGTILTEFTSPSTNPKGLTWDGEFLWNVDQDTNTIYKIDSGIIPLGIIGCVEKNGIPLSADALLTQETAIDQVTALDSEGCFVFSSFVSGVGVNLEISEQGVDEKPVITLTEVNGSVDVYIEVGGAYVEPGYSALDTEDGDITASVFATPDVITNPLLIDTSVVNNDGIPITYDVIDSAGNAADTQTRLVFITPVAYEIGGTVSGLNGGNSVTITNNGSDALTISSDSGFTFPVQVVDGLTYDVQVATQPTGQTCTVTNGAGTASADVSNVQVVCADIFYAINVNASGLEVGDILSMQNNAVTADLTANGITEIDSVPYNASYSVSIVTPPTNKTCAIGERSDATTGNALADVNIDVECEYIVYSLGGTLTGLEAGDTPALRVEFDTVLTTLTTDGAYTLSNGINSGSSYTVTLNQTPTNKNCTITNESGVATADVTDINIDCVDNIAPPAPLIDTLITNDTTPTITGSATTEAGDVLTIVVGSATYTNVIVTGGIWSLDTGTAVPSSGTFNPLSDGVYDIGATLTDSVGNAANDESSNELTIDTVAPAAPSVSGLITNIVPPGPITGTATLASGETLSVTINGASYDNVNAVDGSWSIDLSAATPTSGTLGTFIDGNAYEVVASASDLAGNVANDPSNNEIVIDQTAPAAPSTPDLTDSSDTGSSNTDNITADVTPSVTGACTSGEVMTLYVDGANTGVVQTCSAATYTLTSIANLPDGAHSIAVSATDLAGNESALSNPALAITIDATAPAIPTVTPAITNDTTPVLSGTATLASGETLSVTVNGFTFSSVGVAANAWSLDTETASPDSGTFTALSDASYDIVATITDAAGNSSPDATSGELVIDTIAPAIPTVNTQTTNDLTPTITGSATLASGESLSVTVNGATYDNVPTNSSIWSVDTGLLTPSSGTLGEFVNGSTYEVVATATDTAGNSATDTSTNELSIDVTPPTAPTVDILITNDLTPTLSGTAPSGAGEVLSVIFNGATYNNVTVSGGTWSIDTETATPSSGTLGALLDGNTYDVLATVTDAASLATSDVTSNEVTIDQTAPAAPAIPDMTDATDRGQLSDDDITSDNTPTFTGTCTDTETLRLYVDGSSTSANIVCSDNLYTLTSPNALTDGAHTVAVSATDLAGNESTLSGALSVTIDTAAPVAPGEPDLAAASDSGSSDTDNVTGVSNPEFIGTCVDGEIVSIYVDGNATGDSGLCTTSAYSVTLTSPLNSGTFDITARASDVAGNISGPSTGLTIVIDTTAANAPAAPDMTAATDTGRSTDDNITSDTTPTFTGTCTNGDTVALYVDSVSTGDNVVCASSTYVITPVVALADGDYSITATATGASGLESPQSQAALITVDTTAPVAPNAPDLTSGSDTGLSNSDNITAETFPIMSGACANDEIITLYLDGLSTSANNLCSANTWTIAAPNALVSNTYAFTATATDIAGNQSAQSVALNVEVDTLTPAAPATPDLDSASDTGTSNTDNITSITTPLLIGSCTTGEQIRLYVDGSQTSATTICSAAAYAINTPDPLTNGDHTVSVTTTDLAGNTSAVSGSLTITIDTLAPVAPGVDTQITNNTTPVLSGSAVLGAGETLSVSINGSNYDAVAVTGGLWSLDTASATVTSGSVFSALADGAYDVSATVVDTAGNSASDSSTNELTIDTTPPAAPAAPDLADASDTGSSNSDDITNDNLPTFIGTCSTGDTLQLYVNAAATGATANCVASTYSVTATAALSDGSQTISVTATDSAGNESAESATLGIVIDTSAPLTPSVDTLTTNDTTPVISGSASLSAGDTLRVSVNGATYDSVTVTAGVWSIDLGTATPTSGSLGVFVDTTYGIQAVVTDIAGNTATDASSAELTIDTTAPSTPAVTDMTATSDTGLFDNDNITSISTPTFTGSCTDGDTINLYVDTVFNSSSVCSSGTYAITAAALAEGSRAITVSATDPVGNESARSLVLSTLIDVTAPSAPAVVDLVTADDSGLSNSDNITSVTSPGFAGSCTNNDTITLVIDGSATTATQQCAAASYALTAPTTLADGSHDISIRATDLAGNTGADSTPLSLLIDTAAPVQPASPDLNDLSDTGLSTTDNITTDTSPTFIGSCTDGDLVKLYLDSADTGISMVCSASAYSLTQNPVLVDGNYAYTVTNTDPAGNESTASASLSVTVDTSTPATPTVDTLLTNDTTPSITGSATMGAGDVLSVTVNGATYDNVAVTGGAWTLDTETSTPDNGALGSFTDGNYEVVATITDAAGNAASDISVNELTIDTTPPSAPPAPDMIDASDTGFSSIDNITRDTTPTFSGACTNNQTITLYIDGSATSANVLCSSNIYSLASPLSLSEGSHTAGVSASDAAGNESALSASVTITVDTTAPGAPGAPDMAASSDTGISASDNITSDTVPEFNGTCTSGEVINLYLNSSLTDSAACIGGIYTLTSVSPLANNSYTAVVTATDLAGNESTTSSALSLTIDTLAPVALSAPDMLASSDSGASDTDNVTQVTTPSFSGSCNAGDTVLLYVDGSATGVSASCGAGSYTITSGSTLADGNHNIAVSATDAAGNEGPVSSSLTITVDTQAPVASVPDMTDASDSGSVQDDDITNDTTPSFIGACATGETLTLFVDGTTTGLTAACGASSYALTAVTPLSDGSHSITVTATDSAGNTGAQSAPVLTITVDTNAPSAPGVAPDMTAASDSGTSNTDNVTNVVLPSFTGACTDGAIVSLYVDTNNTGASTVCASSSYTLTAPDSLNNGNHNITVTTTDIAGNESTQSPALTITIDTGGPNVPATPDLDTASDSGLSATDDITNVTLPSVSGICSDGDTIRLYVDGSSTTSTAVCSSNSYSLTPPNALSDGGHTLSVTAEDSSGNESAQSVALAVTIDTIAIALAAPDLIASSDTGTSAFDDITSDTTPQFSGVCTSGEQIRLYIDGSLNSTPNPATCSGSAYSITAATALADGVRAATVINTDLAGNTSAASIATNVTIDTTVPAVPTVDAITANTETPTLSGTATTVAGDVLQVSVNGASYNNVAVSAGIWTLDLASATPSSGTLGSFVDGNSYNVVATLSDSAGNASSDVSTNELTIDTEVSLTINLAGYNSANPLVINETVSGTASVSMTADGNSTPVVLPYGASYTFAIATQPTGQVCIIPASADVPQTTISGTATTDATVNVTCSDITQTYSAAPALGITANNGNNNALITETTTIAIADDRQIADLNVYINMTHTYMGDISFDLTSPSGTTVRIVERPGSTADINTLGNSASGDYGCSGNNMDATLDDEAGSSVEDSCNPVSGTLTPNNPLSAFDGESAQGTWTLTIYDSYGTADGGTLNNWSLEVIIPQL